MLCCIKCSLSISLGWHLTDPLLLQVGRTQILLADAPVGYFVVRESSSSMDAYVLACREDSGVVEYVASLRLHTSTATSSLSLSLSLCTHTQHTHSLTHAHSLTSSFTHSHSPTHSHTYPRVHSFKVQNFVYARDVRVRRLTLFNSLFFLC